MDFIRDLTQSIGLQPETFDYLIVLVIIVGGVWAAKRLYTDLTGPPIDFSFDGESDDQSERAQEFVKPIKLGRRKRKNKK